MPAKPAAPRRTPATGAPNERLSILVPGHELLMDPTTQDVSGPWTGMDTLTDFVEHSMSASGPVDLLLAFPELTRRQVDMDAIMRMIDRLHTRCDRTVKLVTFQPTNPATRPERCVLRTNHREGIITVQVTAGRDLVCAPDQANGPFTSREWIQVLAELGINCRLDVSDPACEDSVWDLMSTMPDSLFTVLRHGYHLPRHANQVAPQLSVFCQTGSADDAMSGHFLRSMPAEPLR